MIRKTLLAGLAALPLLAWTSGGTLAQTPPPAAPAHHGLFGGLFHHPRPSTTPGTMGSHMPMMGNIIGNKKTHVYHLPGDRGALPAPQNRIYFRTVAQAQAAGYHASGLRHSGAMPRMHSGLHPMMPHGSFGRPTPAPTSPR